MARFNEILVARYNRALQKLLSMKGPPPAPQLASEIQPVFPLFWGAEMRYLEGWNRYGFGAIVSAVAAINSTLRIRNPGGSNVIVVIERASVGGETGADVVRLGYVTTAADLVVSATGANNRLDLRQQSAGPASIISNSDATHPGSLITTLAGTVPANQMYEFVFTGNDELPLLPGQAIDLWANTVNLGLNVSLEWRERALEESERF